MERNEVKEKLDALVAEGKLDSYNKKARTPKLVELLNETLAKGSAKSSANPEDSKGESTESTASDGEAKEKVEETESTKEEEASKENPSEGLKAVKGDDKETPTTAKASDVAEGQEMVKVILTEADLKMNPELGEKGLKAGDEIEVAKPNIQEEVDHTKGMSDKQVKEKLKKMKVDHKKDQKPSILRRMLQTKLASKQAFEELQNVSLSDEEKERIQIIGNLKQIGFPVDLDKSNDDLKNDLLNALLHLLSEREGVVKNPSTGKTKTEVTKEDCKAAIAYAHSVVSMFQVQMRAKRRPDMRWIRMSKALYRMISMVK